MKRDIESLYGVIRPKRDEMAPAMILAYSRVPCKDNCEVPCVHLEIEDFVRMSLLSDELKAKVRSELKDKAEIVGDFMHPKTRAEFDEAGLKYKMEPEGDKGKWVFINR